MIQELTGVSRKTLNVFALALGVYGVKSEGRFAATAQAGDDDQAIARNLKREVLEIVFARAADADEFPAHGYEFWLKAKWSNYGKTGKKQRVKDSCTALT